jgi:hypothetical protein
MDQQPASSIRPARRSPPDTAHAGQAVYTPAFLALYDWYVLGLSNTWAWRCPTRYLQTWYDQHVSANHLDVGVGTGYFLDHCHFPSPSPAITLLDMNPATLRTASRRLHRYRPRTQEANVLQPLQLEGRGFDSIGLNFLLHCLPGSFAEKGVVFAHLKPWLNAGGVMFGSTILGKGVRRNGLARALMAFYNKKGIFSNLEDDKAGLERALADHFHQHQIHIRGCVALFSARD